jgi:transcriptional regulator
MHKTPSLQKPQGNDTILQKQEPENQDRRAKVLMLHSKGYSQSEISVKLNVNQSTISRDLAEIRKKARSSLDVYVKDEIPNEFQIYISGLNQIIKNLWEMVDDEGNSKITVKERVYLLSLLMQCYSKRIEMLVGGPDSKMNARKHMHDIQYDETHPWMNR